MNELLTEQNNLSKPADFPHLKAMVNNGKNWKPKFRPKFKILENNWTEHFYLENVLGTLSDSVMPGKEDFNLQIHLH